jgi:uncharacterized phage-associated protein
MKKLHKLLYYCQGHHLAAFGEPLFIDAIEAWDRGPVVASLWREEKYGPLLEASDPIVEEAGLNTVGYVVSRYATMTGADLEALSHGEPPWQLADQRRRLTGEQRMGIDEIRAFFKTARPADESVDDDDYEPPAQLVQGWLAATTFSHDAPAKRDEIGSLRDLIRQ